jgi:undecaprenyl-diphosphatase
VVSGIVEQTRAGIATPREHVEASQLRAGARVLRPGALVVAGLTLVYAALTVAVLTGSPLVALDTAALRWAVAAHQPTLYTFLWDWVLLGQRAVVLAVAVLWLAVHAVRHRDVRPLITLGVATLLLNISVGLAKTVIGRVGPLQLGPAALHPAAATIFTDGTIFPSGHTANAVVTWGLLALMARRRRRLWAGVAAFLALSVGLSTIYLGTHWVSDVLAGWVAGALVLLAMPALTPVVDRLERLALRLVPLLRGRPVAPLAAGARMRSWTSSRPSVPARSAHRA